MNRDEDSRPITRAEAERIASKYSVGLPTLLIYAMFAYFFPRIALIIAGPFLIVGIPWLFWKGAAWIIDFIPNPFEVRWERGVGWQPRPPKGFKVAGGEIKEVSGEGFYYEFWNNRRDPPGRLDRGKCGPWDNAVLAELNGRLAAQRVWKTTEFCDAVTVERQVAKAEKAYAQNLAVYLTGGTKKAPGLEYWNEAKRFNEWWDTRQKKEEAERTVRYQEEARQRHQELHERRIKQRRKMRKAYEYNPANAVRESEFHTDSAGWRHFHGGGKIKLSEEN